MIYRLAYGALIMLLLGVFCLLLSLKLIPYWQSKYRYEPISLGEKSLCVAWADGGAASEVEGNASRVTIANNLQFSFLHAQREVEEHAIKILVRENLPERESYIVKIDGPADSLLLPLRRQRDGSYASTEFIPLGDVGTSRYFHGVRVFHVRGNTCQLTVEKVVKL